jgi:catechol 2,3-dioxygenase-like lactoylglutathione lyase family enzyme
MIQSLAAVTVLVPSYDDGLAFFRDVLGFEVLEDTALSPNKRWVVVASSRGAGAALVLAVPSDERQKTRVGDQTGGRVAFFLHSGDFWVDYEKLLGRTRQFPGNAAPRALWACSSLCRPLGRKTGFATAGERGCRNIMRFCR